MSKDFGEMPVSTSSYYIRRAMENLQRMSEEEHIDMMVRAKLLTPKEAERAKKKWAEIQAANPTAD